MSHSTRLLAAIVITSLSFRTISAQQPAPSSYSYSRQITFWASNVPGTLTNFPALISGTYSFLADIQNGGRVQSASGYDIVFTSDAAGLDRLPHEIDSYNPVSGAVAFWVQVPSLSNSSSIYMWYGNPLVTQSQENATSLWAAASYQSVWHLGSSSGVLSTKDSTSNGNSGTINGTTVTSVSGKIGGAASFINNGSSAGFISVSVRGLPFGTNANSLEAWANLGSLPAANGNFMFSYGDCGTGEASGIFTDNPGGAPPNAPVFTIDGPGLLGPSSLGAGWNQIVATSDGNNHSILYVNSVQVTSGTVMQNIASSANGYIGSWVCGNASWGMNGIIDEVRISSVPLTQNWITAEYNNVTSPSSFAVIGSEVFGFKLFSPAGPGATNPTINLSWAHKQYVFWENYNNNSSGTAITFECPSQSPCPSSANVSGSQGIYPFTPPAAVVTGDEVVIENSSGSVASSHPFNVAANPISETYSASNFNSLPQLDLLEAAANNSTFSGFADPAVRKDPSGSNIWLAYSYPTTKGDGTEVVEIHLTSSQDGGATWNQPHKLWSDPNTTCGNPGCQSYETANFVSDGTKWYGVFINYPSVAGQNLYDNLQYGDIIFATSSTDPSGFDVASNYSEVSFASFRPALTACYAWNEPALYYSSTDGYIYLFIQCLPTVQKASVYPVYYAFRASPGSFPNPVWTIYGPSFGGTSDAQNFSGAKFLTEMDVAAVPELDGTMGLVAIVTPDAAYPGGAHLGCYVLEMSLNQKVALTTTFFDASFVDNIPGEGNSGCSYDPFVSTGVLFVRKMPVPNASEGGIFSLFATGVFP